MREEGKRRAESQVIPLVFTDLTNSMAPMAGQYGGSGPSGQDQWGIKVASFELTTRLQSLHHSGVEQGSCPGKQASHRNLFFPSSFLRHWFAHV